MLTSLHVKESPSEAPLVWRAEGGNDSVLKYFLILMGETSTTPQ